jgi:hypothetical protein
MLAALLLMSQAVPPPPAGYVLDKPDPWAEFAPKPVACPKKETECRPWARDPIVPTNPFDQFDPAPAVQLGHGPHTLIISDGSAMTRIPYKSGAACQHARDNVRLQTDASLTNRNPYVVYGPPRVTAFCVPR